jgi:hypothetical protein
MKHRSDFFPAGDCPFLLRKRTMRCAAEGDLQETGLSFLSEASPCKSRIVIGRINQ